MEHPERPFLITSATHGQRLRERIRREREHDQRHGREAIIESQRLIEEANRIMAAFARITSSAKIMLTDKTCPECNGEGIVDQSTEDERRCPTCGGSGIVPDDRQDSEEVLNTRGDAPA